MSDFSLTLVLQIKTSKIINDMAKVQQKSETVLRGIEKQATENISYTAEKTGNVYDFNTAEKLNQLLIKLLLATGHLRRAEHTTLISTYTGTVLSLSQHDNKRTVPLL